jgi:steroid 5-alpha reductase family enzyme
MMHVVLEFLPAVIAVGSAMAIWYILSLILRRMDIIDVAWGIGFIVIAGAGIIHRGSVDTRGIIVTTLVVIWALRLSTHIARRFFSHSEDRRYAAWRKDWGTATPLRSLVQVFTLQAFLQLVVSSSVTIILLRSNSPLTILDYLGILIWIFGFLFEAIADQQLRSFIINPANNGKIMTSGLWRYSRHPNYFGEVTQWWALWLIACSVPYGIWTIIAPLTITLLIRYVSGVPLLEKNYTGRADWEAYKSKTSVLIPLRPRR